MPEPRVRSRPRRTVLLALASLALVLSPGLARSQAPAGAPAKIPSKAEAVLRSLDESGHAPAGVLGGRPYENQARRGEQPLPRVDREGDPIAYRTWDVNPEVPGRGRGAERLVTGSDGSAYYTPDDYKTFHPIRNPSRSTLAGAVHAKPPEERPRPPMSNRNAPARPAEKPVVALDPATAARVMPVVDRVLKDGEPPPDHVGGREYRNLGLDGGETLPRVDAQGRPIRYREWDVNRRVPGRNRGAERLVTGSDGRAYYTRDHYLTFQRVR